MSHITITLNGDQVVNSDSGQWTDTPPEDVRKYLKPATPGSEPWVQPMQVVLAPALIANRDITIDIQTGDGWTGMRWR